MKDGDILESARKIMEQIREMRNAETCPLFCEQKVLGRIYYPTQLTNDSPKLPIVEFECGKKYSRAERTKCPVYKGKIGELNVQVMDLLDKVPSVVPVNDTFNDYIVIASVRKTPNGEVVDLLDKKTGNPVDYIDPGYSDVLVKSDGKLIILRGEPSSGGVIPHIV